jgi:hypothetical protein
LCGFFRNPHNRRTLSTWVTLRTPIEKASIPLRGHHLAKAALGADADLAASVLRAARRFPAK